MLDYIFLNVIYLENDINKTKNSSILLYLRNKVNEHICMESVNLLTDWMMSFLQKFKVLENTFLSLIFFKGSF